MSGEAGGAVTADAIFDGAVRIWQPRHGYRFGIDALLLAELAQSGLPAGHAAREAWDIGAGSGVVALALLAALPARRPVAKRAVAVEIDPALCALAVRSAADNGLADRLEVRTQDARALLEGPRREADLVLSNPPFFSPARGSRPADAQRAVARHELHLRVPELLAVAAHLLAPGGRFCLVHRAERIGDLRHALAAAGLTLTRERLVRPRAGAPTKVVLLEAVAGGGQGRGVIEDEIVLHVFTGAPGGGMSHTPEVERFLRTGVTIGTQGV